MTIQEVEAFFMWCTIIDAVLLTFSAVVFVFAGNWIYRIQNKWFPISREIFNVAIYSYFGLFKIAFFVFNLTPYIALVIIS